MALYCYRSHRSGLETMNSDTVNRTVSAGADVHQYPYEFNQEIRRRARSVSSELLWMSVVSTAVELSLLFFITFAGPGKWIASSLEYLSWFPRVCIFSSTIVLLFYAVGMPFAYRIHGIRKRYGIATAGTVNWLTDSLKALLISMVFITGASTLLLALISLSNLWWLLAATAYVLFTVTYSRFFPFLALRFFYRIRPLEEGEVSRKIMALLKSLSLDRMSIYVIDESSRSTMANAFVAGIGKKKRIVLYDNTIRFFTPEEVTCITAHELGHYLAGDSWKSWVSNVLMAYISALLLYAVYSLALHMHSLYSPTDPYVLLLFSITLSITGAALTPLTNYISRKRERCADLFSLNAYRNPVAFISSEKRLCDLNLMDDDPGTIRKILFATHPSTAERVRMGEAWRSSAEAAKEG